MSTRQEKPAKIQKTLPCRRKNGSPGILNVNTAREGELGGRGRVRYGAGKTGGGTYLSVACNPHFWRYTCDLLENAVEGGGAYEAAGLGQLCLFGVLVD